MPNLPPLLKAALQLRAETDLSRFFLPAMPNPTPLNPAAQAVLDAIKAVSPAPADEIAAVALRAAADQVITENRLVALNTERSAESRLLLIWVRDQFRAIAAELEGQQSTSSTH